MANDDDEEYFQWPDIPELPEGLDLSAMDEFFGTPNAADQGNTTPNTLDPEPYANEGNVDPSNPVFQNDMATAVRDPLSASTPRYQNHPVIPEQNLFRIPIPVATVLPRTSHQDLNDLMDAVLAEASSSVQNTRDDLQPAALATPNHRASVSQGSPNRDLNDLMGEILPHAGPVDQQRWNDAQQQDLVHTPTQVKNNRDLNQIMDNFITKASPKTQKRWNDTLQAGDINSDRNLDRSMESLIAETSPRTRKKWHDVNTALEGDTAIADTEAARFQPQTSPYRITAPRPKRPAALDSPMSNWEMQNPAALEHAVKTPGNDSVFVQGNPDPFASGAGSSHDVRSAAEVGGEKWQQIPLHSRCDQCAFTSIPCDVTLKGLPCTHCENQRLNCDISRWFDDEENVLRHPKYKESLLGLVSHIDVENMPDFPTRRPALSIERLPIVAEMMHPKADVEHMGLGAFLDDGSRLDSETLDQSVRRQELARENMGISMHPMRELQRLCIARDERTRSEQRLNNFVYAELKARTNRELARLRLRLADKVDQSHYTYDAAYAEGLLEHERRRRSENALRREAAKRWAREYAAKNNLQRPGSPDPYEDSDNELTSTGSWKVSVLRPEITRATPRLVGDVPVNTEYKKQRCGACTHSRKTDCNVGDIGIPCTRCSDRNNAESCKLIKPIDLLAEKQPIAEVDRNPAGKIPTFAQRSDAEEYIHVVAKERGVTYNPRSVLVDHSLNTEKGVGVGDANIDLRLRDTSKPQRTSVESGQKSKLLGSSSSSSSYRPQQGYDRGQPRKRRITATRATNLPTAPRYMGLHPAISIRPSLPIARQAAKSSASASASASASTKTRTNLDGDQCWPCKANNRICSGKTGGTTFWPWCAECFEREDAQNCMWGSEEDILEYAHADMTADSDPAILYRRRFVALQACQNALKEGREILPPFESVGAIGQASVSDAAMIKNKWAAEWNERLLQDPNTPLPDFTLGPLPGIPTEHDSPGQWELRAGLLRGERLSQSDAGNACNERGVWSEEEWFMMMARPVMNQMQPHNVSPARVCDYTPHDKGLSRFHTCDTCHDDQLAALSVKYANIFEATKMWFCKDCAVLAKSTYIDQSNLFQVNHCTCDKQTMLAWLCHMHRIDALDQVKQRTNLVDEWLRRNASLVSCGHSTSVVHPNANLGHCESEEPVGDPDSGVWRCKSCTDIVIDPEKGLLPLDEAVALNDQYRAAFRASFGREPPQVLQPPAASIITRDDYIISDLQEQQFLQQITTQRQIARDRNPGLLRGG